MESPWTEDQVDSLNKYQHSGLHPFTSQKGKILIATKDGWIEEVGGLVVQNWAHSFMLNWNWKKILGI